MMVENKQTQVNKIDDNQNKKFGYLFTIVFVIIGIAIWVNIGHFVLWPWIVSILFLFAAILFSSVLHPLYKLWMKIGDLLHHILSPIILGLLFFILITPIGLLMRILGKRPIAVNFDNKIDSYWIKRESQKPASETMKQQF